MRSPVSLKAILSSRKGSFVPSERHLDLFPEVLYKNIQIGKYFGHVIHPEDQISLSEVKDFYKRTFYREAPIPLALQLGLPNSKYSFHNNNVTKKFIEREMNLYLNSGVSVLIRNNEKLVGAGLSCLWTRDEAYEIIDDSFDAKCWHNTAAQIASEHEPEAERNTVWRGFQFQHLYNLSQRLMAKHKKDKTLYLATFFVLPEVRGAGVTSILFGILPELFSRHNIMLLSQSNFRASDKMFEKLGNNVQVAEYVRYDEEELVLDGTKAFQVISNLDGIKFYVAF